MWLLALVSSNINGLSSYIGLQAAMGSAWEAAGARSPSATDGRSRPEGDGSAALPAIGPRPWTLDGTRN
jgi:hypothetical protein